MKETDSFFVVGKCLLNARIDPEGLAIGSLLYVKRNDEGTPVGVMPQRSEGDEDAFVVASVEPDEQRYELLETLEFSDPYPERLRQELNGLVDSDIVEQTIQRLSLAMRLAHVRRESNPARKKLEILSLVLDRLDLCQRISRPEVQKAMFWYYGQVITHLLLTCFDRLGQPVDSMGFIDWLSADEYSVLRAQSIDSLCDPIQPAKAAEVLFRSYRAAFGNRTSFNRFLSSVLPDQHRVRLFGSIRIEQFRIPGYDKIDSGGDKAKLKLLWDLRNEFTHGVAGPRFFGPDIFKGLQSEEYRDSWLLLRQRIDENHLTNVMVHDWPEALCRAVRAGLASFLLEGVAGLL